MTELERAVRWLESEEQRVSQAMKTDSIPKEFIFARAIHIKNCRVLLDALRWVPVSERLPTEADADENDMVLTLDTEGKQETFEHYDIKEWNEKHPDKITHWRTLPPKPESEG